MRPNFNLDNQLLLSRRRLPVAAASFAAVLQHSFCRSAQSEKELNLAPETICRLTDGEIKEYSIRSKSSKSSAILRLFNKEDLPDKVSYVQTGIGRNLAVNNLDSINPYSVGESPYLALTLPNGLIVMNTSNIEQETIQMKLPLREGIEQALDARFNLDDYWNIAFQNELVHHVLLSCQNYKVFFADDEELNPAARIQRQKILNSISVLYGTEFNSSAQLGEFVSDAASMMQSIAYVDLMADRIKRMLPATKVRDHQYFSTFDFFNKQAKLSNQNLASNTFNPKRNFNISIALSYSKAALSMLSYVRGFSV